jgi:hypothetical protein
VSYVTPIRQILSTKLELWYLDGILTKKAHGCVENVAGQVLSTNQEVWRLDGEEILTKKVRVIHICFNDFLHIKILFLFPYLLFYR